MWELEVVIRPTKMISVFCVHKTTNIYALSFGFLAPLWYGVYSIDLIKMNNFKKSLISLLFYGNKKTIKIFIAYFSFLIKKFLK